jgi:hypothetical protein
MKSRLRNRLLGFGLIASLCLVQACQNLGPTGGHRAKFNAGTITSLSPSSVMAGGPPFTLTLNGSNFNQGFVTLVWNGTTNIQVAQGSDTQVSFAIPASLIANPASISIQLIDSVPGDRPSNTVTFTIVPRGTTACALFGLYNFLFTGFDTRPLGIPQFNKNNGGAIFAGAFGVDANGNLSGELDWTDYPFRSETIVPTGGSPIVGTCTNSATPNQGTATFKFMDNFGNPVTLTFTFLLQQGGSGPARGRLIKFADMNSTLGTLVGTGVFVATADAVLNGDYAFGLVGIDPGDSGSGSQIGAAGTFTYSSGNLGAGVADINDGGTVTANAPVSGAMFPNAPPDLYSRVARDLTIGGQLVHLAIYANSSGGGFAIGEIPSQTANTRAVAGIISPQTNAGAYTNGSLNAPLVFSTWGAPAPLYTGASYTTSSDTTLGLASGFNSSAGTFNLQFDNISAGVANLNQAVSGATYSVASNGRTTVSYTLGGNTVNYVYYLDSPNDGFILGESGTAAEFGFFQPQASGPFTTSTINGTFASATFLPMTPASPNVATEITLNNGTLSANTPAGALAGTYAVAPSGRGTASVNLPVLGGNNLVLYVIGPGSVVVMGSDNTMNNAITFMHF